MTAPVSLPERISHCQLQEALNRAFSSFVRLKTGSKVIGPFQGSRLCFALGKIWRMYEHMLQLINYIWVTLLCTVYIVHRYTFFKPQDMIYNILYIMCKSTS